MKWNLSKNYLSDSHLLWIYAFFYFWILSLETLASLWTWPQKKSPVLFLQPGLHALPVLLSTDLRVPGAPGPTEVPRITSQREKRMAIVRKPPEVSNCVVWSFQLFSSIISYGLNEGHSKFNQHYIHLNHHMFLSPQCNGRALKKHKAFWLSPFAACKRSCAQ